MSWDRVIQDSDEDEPLGDDGVEAPPSPGPHQVQLSSEQQLQNNSDQYVAEHQPNYPIEPPAVQQPGAEPDFGVNFDQFLQSQDASQSAVTLSQRQREERWIPSTADGGVGSIGAMMTDIGHAQCRLLDDDVSSAVQLLPSTDTPYPSEVSQPGSFPSIPNYPSQQVNETIDDSDTYTRPVVQASYEATQLIAPTHADANGYEYNTPATSNNVDSPSGEPNDRLDTITTSVQLNDGYANHSHKPAQRSRSMQSQMWSPHDTEPLSSVLSPGLSRSKSDNTRSGLMSPRHSEGSAHDELSLPMVPSAAADTPAVAKKRGRPKKQPLPEDDEEDELAAPAPRNFFDSERSKTAEMRRRGALYKNQEAAKMDVTEIIDEGDELSTSEFKPPSTPELMVVLPVAFDGKPKSNNAAAAAEPRPATTLPKKKKVKRSKTASAILDKPQEVDVHDDVIWLDSNPVHVDEHKATEQADEPQAEEVHEPKKRGRKRKKTTENLVVETAPVSEGPPQQPDTENENENETTPNALKAGDNEEASPEPANEITMPTSSSSSSKGVNSRQQNSSPHATASRQRKRPGNRQTLTQGPNKAQSDLVDDKSAIPRWVE